MEKSDWAVLGFISASILLVVASTTWLFMFKQDYHFVVEAECDPASQSCFERDCSNTDDCPPNQLSVYRTFQVRAADFKSCADNSCLKECTSGVISCNEIMCGDSEEDECAETPETPEIPHDTSMIPPEPAPLSE
jgi:hypothetical protein